MPASDGRDAILRALPRAAGEPVPPPAFASADASRDPVADFARNLEAAGGRAEVLAGPAELGPALRSLRNALGAERVFSTVDELESTVSRELVPHALADLDLAVLAGGPAVAESGAVWWRPRDARERAAAFLAEHVVLVVPRDALVDELHAAYARIDPAAGPFGAFLAGPSKTADIAQALVIGAHGARSLTALLVER